MATTTSCCMVVQMLPSPLTSKWGTRPEWPDGDRRDMGIRIVSERYENNIASVFPNTSGPIDLINTFIPSAPLAKN
ncbi:hypothetical protein [Agrobacterium tumefaciens]|uniref:hypothetical protein n=1 Tax=Agrobacterium tumefaciens TaxID=358 RepID=UPI00287E36C3|nr:hypothetical protein [Agrobacterium tumefaciens]MDS7594962.1 hypothetical protein [Agrobacterium tumefaciens]